jgi:hypothetical protein
MAERIARRDAPPGPHCRSRRLVRDRKTLSRLRNNSGRCVSKYCRDASNVAIVRSARNTQRLVKRLVGLVEALEDVRGYDCVIARVRNG